MNKPLACLAMRVARALWGPDHADWARAAEAELALAVPKDEALRFATGCLLAAARALPATGSGRHRLATYGLALGMIVPLAAIELGCAVLGLPYLFPGGAGLPGAILAGREHLSLIGGTYQTLVPLLSLMLIMLAIAQLALAWALLERDNGSVERCRALLLATSITLFLFMAGFALDASQVVLLGAVLAAQFGAVALLGHWRTHLDEAAMPAPG